MVTPVSITHQFNGDTAAADLVDAAQLDTQLANLATGVNAEIAERRRTVKDGGGLANQAVRYAALHPEVVTSLAGLIFLEDAKVATTANITLSGLQTLDGYLTIAGDRVLVLAQTDQTQNGIYTAAAGSWSRTADFQGAQTTVKAIAILNGTAYAGTTWRLYADATIGSTTNTWIQIQGFAALLPVTRGGTGANNAAGARTNLGLGTVAVLNAITQAFLASDVFYQVDTIAALKALTSGSHDTVYVRGYYAVGDSGGGIFRWNGADATADNGGTVIAPTTGSGRWNRQNDGDAISVRCFGCKLDNTADDTLTYQAAITWCDGTDNRLYQPPGSAKITAPLVVSGAGLNWTGAGSQDSKLVASGNFDAIVQCSATSSEVKVSFLSFIQTGTTTKCVNLQAGSQVISFWDCSFTGNGAGISLVLSQSNGYCNWGNCRWDMNAATTTGLQLDMLNQNTRVYGASRFGGIGLGCSITKSGASARVEGTSFDCVQFINTGAYQLNIGNSLLTQVSNCNLDQGGTYAITVSGGADQVQVTGCWLGMAAGTGICLNFDSTSGGGHIVGHNVFTLGATAINVGAAAGVRIDGLLIDGNTFASHTSTTLQLDSVKNCRITNNRDTSTAATNGSWYTTNNAVLAGSYVFDNNQWATNVTIPVLFDATSTYRFGNDQGGMVGRNKGTSTSGGGTTSLVINHGCFRTPSAILATPISNVGTFFVNTITATQFTVTWATAGAQTWHWQAEV